MLRASSCGERGTRAAKWAGLGMCDSLGGICRERPLERKSGRRGVLGLASMVWSSFDMRADSWIFGDGSRRGVLSERDRALGDCVFGGVVTTCDAITAPSRSPGSRLLVVSGVVVAVNIATREEEGGFCRATGETHYISEAL